MDSISRPTVGLARSTGLLYILIIISGIFSEVVVRASLIIPGDATATANNILSSSPMFRLGFASDTLMLLCDVAVAVLLYVLLKPVDRTLALTAAAFRLIQAAILGGNLLNYHAALLLLSGAEYQALLPVEQLYSQALLFLELHSHGYDLGLIFFGLSNVILGYLVIRSGYLPSILGYGLIAAALVYLGGSFSRFLYPEALAVITPLYVIPLLTELGFCLWLLIKGIDTRKTVGVPV